MTKRHIPHPFIRLIYYLKENCRRADFNCWIDYDTGFDLEQGTILIFRSWFSRFKWSWKRDIYSAPKGTIKISYDEEWDEIVFVNLVGAPYGAKKDATFRLAMGPTPILDFVKQLLEEK